MEQAADHAARGHTLLLLSSTDLVRFALGSKPRNGPLEWSGIEKHVCLIKELAILPTESISVRLIHIDHCSLVTWGRLLEPALVPLPLFLRWFRGFIVVFNEVEADNLQPETRTKEELSSGEQASDDGSKGS